MNSTVAFLKHVLPGEGHYAAFILETKKHLWTDSFDQLGATILKQDALGRTVYHACASFAKPTRRSQENARAARSFWLDIDAGEGKPYADAIEAAQRVSAFCNAVNLPIPTCVGSGSGLHVYWPLVHALEPELWKRYALGLKARCEREGLAAGPERTADIASILRTPGTHWRKQGVREVVCGRLTGPYELELFGGLLNENTERPSVSRKPAPKLAAALADTFDGEPRYADCIANQCEQLRSLRASHGRMPEPLWYAALGVLAFCDDGSEFGHAWSSGYAGYTPEETQARLDRARTLSGATTCDKFHSLNPKVCEACPHFGKIKSPISLGRSNSDSEIVVPAVGEKTNPFGETIGENSPASEIDALPQLPHDFAWSKSRALITKTESKNGVALDVVVSSYPIYLGSVQTGEVRGEWNLVLHQYLPTRGWFDISISAKTLFGSQSGAELADRGANIREHTHFIRYVRDAIDMLYRTGKLNTRFDQFGWKQNDTTFLYGLDLYSREGATRVLGSDELQVRCREDWVGPARGGELSEWKRAVNFLFVAGCEPQSVALLAAFAAPLMRFQERDEGGAIVHLVSRKSGMGKSTALIGAASVWGRREGLGLTNDDTKVSKALTLGALGNMPVIYDEVAIRDPDAIRSFVVNFTNGRDKMRATRSGEIRHAASTWQTILISAANTSLVDVLSSQNMPEAPAYRILEFSLELPAEVAHQQGDALRRRLRTHSGHAGAVYIAWVVKNLPWVKQTLERVTQQTWDRTKLSSEHRFWVRTVAAIGVAGVIVKNLGLVDFSVERIMTYLFDHVSNHPRALGPDWAVDALAEFLNAHISNTLTVPGPYIAGVKVRPLGDIPRQKLAIRYEVSGQRYVIAQSALREWLMPREQSFREMVKILRQSGVVMRERMQATLGGGTDIPGGQVWCLEVNGQHEALAGVAPVKSDNVVNMQPIASGVRQ